MQRAGQKIPRPVLGPCRARLRSARCWNKPKRTLRVLAINMACLVNTHTRTGRGVLLYSDTDKQTAITDFGQYMRNAVPTKVIGAGNLSAALRIFQSRYNRISDLLPSFIGLCEANVTNPQKT